MKNIIFLSLFVFLIEVQSICQNKHSDSLTQTLASAKEDTSKVNSLISLARFYTFSYPDSGATFAKQGLQLAQKINYKSGEANCLSTLCLCSTFLGDYINALDFGLKALAIFQDLHDTTRLVWTNIQIMNCYRYLEDYDQALIYGYKAKRLFRFDYPDSNQISVGLSVIGSLYEKKNNLDSALYYTQKALSWDKSWSGVFRDIGEIYTRMGRSDLALSYFRKGLPIAIKENESIRLISFYNTMSETFEATGQIDSSIYYANKSIIQSGVKANPQGLLQASSQLATLYETQGKIDSTIKYLKVANVLKDSLFSRKKTRDAQSFAFNEKLHQQELVAQHQTDENRIRMAALFTVVLTFLLIAFFLWRNNQSKQKANKLLQQQKEEIQSTLTELKSTQAQLIQSEKMASLGELTAGIAHEIQNPLNFVNNFSEVNKELLEEMKDEIDKGNSVEVKAIANDIIENEQKINHHGKRADAIVKNMLQHSRSSSSQKELTDINKLADEYLRLIYHGMRAKDKDFNATIKTDFDESIGKIDIIPQDIGRVLLNIYNNAFYAVAEKIKHPNSRNGQPEYQPTISLSTKAVKSPLGDLGIITVSDNGNGIPQNIVDKIFQPFFTTKPTGQGTGLGLSLSYDIIKAHGGKIKVETKESVGSEFIIQLPVN